VQLVGEAADDDLAIWPTDARDQKFLDDDHYHLYLGARSCNMHPHVFIALARSACTMCNSGACAI
jgi:hypothetical protein